MYLLINGNRHTAKSRYVPKGKDTVKFLGVAPAVEEISGTIQMYCDDGFLLREDDTSKYERKFMSGTVLTLTNEPEPTPAPYVPTLEEQMAAAILEGVNDV